MLNRRDFMKTAAIAGTTATAASVLSACADAGDDDVGFVLVHGSWHGGWCWDLVAQSLNDAGHITVAIDLPGHGLNAVLPQSCLSRPLDAGAFATEPSGLAGIGIDQFAAAVIDGAERARDAGARKIYAVGHSMGGIPVTFAAAKAPERFDGLIYVAALAPTPGKPAGAYLELADQRDNARIGAVIKADPAAIGALRMDPRSTDTAYLESVKQALAADVDDRQLAAVMHLLTPDAPVVIYGDTVEFPDEFATLKRSYIRCLQDRTVVPSTGEALVADMNAAWPQNPASLFDIDSSHEVMISKPAALAELIMRAL